jgi:hypothetical protein
LTRGYFTFHARIQWITFTAGIVANNLAVSV